MTIVRLISGGQTGSDRGALYGALDAIALGSSVRIGGWAPGGFRAEDGFIPVELSTWMQTTESKNYPQRTEFNVRDSDATLIVFTNKYGVGTAKTIGLAITNKKPLVLVELNKSKIWVSLNGGSLSPCCVTPENLVFQVSHLGNISPSMTLNVAGPRESHSHGLQAKVRVFIRDLLITEVRCDPNR